MPRGSSETTPAPHVRAVTEGDVLEVIGRERTELAKTTQVAVAVADVASFANWLARGGRFAIRVAVNGAILDDLTGDATAAYLAHRVLGVEPLIERGTAEDGLAALITRPWVSLDVIPAGPDDVGFAYEDSLPGADDD